MLFKIVNHQIDISVDHLLIPNPHIHHTRGHNKRFDTNDMPRLLQTLFLPYAIKIWISLSQHMIDITKIEQFKHSLAGLETV